MWLVSLASPYTHPRLFPPHQPTCRYLVQYLSLLRYLLVALDLGIFYPQSDNSRRPDPSRSISGSVYEVALPYSVGMTSCSLHAARRLWS